MNDKLLKKLLRTGIKISLELNLCELVYVLLVPVKDNSYYPCFKIGTNLSLTVIHTKLDITQKEFYSVQIKEAQEVLYGILGPDYLVLT